MESIGEFFRQVRETKGLTLDDVASKTRIHPDFLIALEEGNFTKLPDQVFAKGFVRSYARSLGLDEEDAMRRFEGSAGAFYEKQAERELLRLKQVQDDRRRKANRKVVLAALGVALLGLVLLMSKERTGSVPVHHGIETESSSKPAPPPIAPTPAEVKGSEAGKDQAPAVVPAVSAPPSALVPVSPVLPPGDESIPTKVRTDSLLGSVVSDSPLVLDVEALELTWVVVQVDGGSPEEALMRPGERVQWKGNDRFTLTLGNAGGVRVALNGKEQGPFGPSGKVARDIVLKK
ncbi:helix-turn-helix domain-containing protein [Candidatus Nitrospira bockiana]